MKKYPEILFSLVAIFFPILVSASAVSPQTDTLGFGQSDFLTAPVKKGDRCLVCGIPLKEKGMVILYKGRRVPLLNKQMLQQFLKEPDAYFYKLEYNGALFQESAVTEKPMRWEWLLLGLWIASGLVVAALCAGIALRKGQPAAKAFFIGLAANVPGLLYIYLKPQKGKQGLPPGLAKVPSTADPAPCSSCGEPNHPSAVECSNCGARLTPRMESEVKRAGI